MLKIISLLTCLLSTVVLPPIMAEETTNTGAPKKHIIFFGDSITAGYSIDKDEAFPSLFQQILDKEQLPYISINAGLSGETSAGGVRRIEWILKQKIDIFVLELGANDALRGIPLSSTEENLKVIIKKVRDAHPHAAIYVCQMKAPPNLGADYADTFENLFKKVSEETKSTRIPFILEGVAGNPELNVSDGIHPTPDGHRIIAENIWKVLSKDLLIKK